MYCFKPNNETIFGYNLEWLKVTYKVAITQPVLNTALNPEDASLAFVTESKAKVLLVDDRRENLIALAAVLEPLGQELVLARSGMEALKHLLIDDFALILLDVQMPEMDGFETATLIRQREKSRYIPIIFVTAINTEDRYAFQGYQSGAVDYLPKPIDPDILRSKVNVFVAMYQQAQQIKRQAEELREAERREEEQKRAEAEHELERKYMNDLAERETQLSQFKATLDATLDAVLLFDPQTLRFFYVNQGRLRYWVITPTSFYT